MDKEQLGDLFIKLGETFKKGVFDLSDALPTLEPEIVKLVEPLKI